MEPDENELFLDCVPIYDDYKNVTYTIEDLINLLKCRYDGANGDPLSCIPIL